MKPILFNTEMVRAIQEGRKTATRRVKKNRGKEATIAANEPLGPPPYKAGDVLWVRETWDFQPCITCTFRDSDCGEEPAEMHTGNEDIAGCYLYRADYEEEDAGQKLWRPSIHMPRQAARIFLRVTEVFPERLRESIDEAGVPMWELRAEGIPIYERCRICIADGRENRDCRECSLYDQPRWEFSRLWDSTVPKRERASFGWAANPMVWVVRFERISKDEAEKAEA